MILDYFEVQKSSAFKRKAKKYAVTEKALSYWRIALIKCPFCCSLVDIS